MSFIIDELGTKVVQQGNMIKVMEESIIHLEKELLESNIKYQTALADVSTLTETIKTQRLVYDELSKEYDRDRSLLRGDIKVLRRSMKATEEAVSSNRQTMDSCTTSSYGTLSPISFRTEWSRYSF